MTAVLVATENGLYEFDGAHARAAGQPATPGLAGHRVADVAVFRAEPWTIVDDAAVLHRHNGTWHEITRLKQLTARCVLAAADTVLVGTSEAHLVDAGTGESIRSFDEIDTRDTWYTPWGEPPDTRSLAIDHLGGWWVNVHVGGVWHSPDRGASWREAIEVDADVHQVHAHPSSPTLAVAAAIGFGGSEDGGRSWQWTTEGLHASYCRAVAFAGSTALVSASTGPSTRQAALYRRPMGGGVPFERCRDGLPEWFEANIDTGCLAAAGPVVVVGTRSGEVYQSIDEGLSWALVADDLPPVRALALSERHTGSR